MTRKNSSELAVGKDSVPPMIANNDDGEEFSWEEESKKYSGWKGDDGIIYVTLDNGDNVPTNSQRFRHFLMVSAGKKGKLPQAATLDRVTAMIEARASIDSSAGDRCVAKRVGYADGKLYIALYDAKRRYVEIDESGWRIATSSPIAFAYLDNALAMPEPVAGGQIEELLELLNVSEQDLPLILGWCLGAFRPDYPCPILGMTGGQGTAKSTATNLIKKLVDPSRYGPKEVPVNERDMRAIALTSRVLSFDNLSSMSNRTSDMLCRIVTGTSMGGRALYSNADVSLSNIMAPTIVNGISAPWNRRPDLAQRCITIELQEISENDRRDSKALDELFDRLAPRIFGVLCEALSCALRNYDRTKVEALPRMADWGKWVSAGEEALGYPPGTILNAFHRRQREAIGDSLDHSPLAQAVMALIDKCASEQRFSPTDLLTRLKNDPAAAMPDFPKSAKALTEELTRLRGNLAAYGYVVERRKINAGRIWVLGRRVDTTEQAA